MSYSSFPTIQSPSYDVEINPEDCGIISKPEDGPEISRARFTKSRRTYNYHWNAMPTTDLTTLETFYMETVKGSAEICTWSAMGSTGRIMSLKYRKVSNNHWSVQLVFKEV